MPSKRATQTTSRAWSTRASCWPAAWAGNRSICAPSCIPPLYYPERTAALEVLRAFLGSGESMAFIIDEYGGMQGVTTVQDFVRVIGGDLEVLGPAMRPRVTRRPDGSWLVDGLMTIEALQADLRSG